MDVPRNTGKFLYKALPVFTFIMLFGIFALAQPSTSNLETVVLRLKWKHQFQFAGYYAAIEKGYYKEAGLYVQLVEESGGNAVTDVIHGKANFGITNSELLIKYSQGAPVILIANIFQHSPLILVSLKQENNDNIHFISGKKIMMEQNATEIFAYLKSEGIAIEDSNLINHSFSPEALIQGDVYASSAYSTDEPYLLNKMGVRYNIYSPRASGIDFYGDLLFTSQKELKNKKRVDAFLQASLKGWKYALENEQEIIGLIYNKYSQRHTIEHLEFEAEQTRRLIMPDVVEIGYINKNRWERIREIYAEFGMLHNTPDIDSFIYTKDNAQTDISLYYFMLIIIAIAALSLFIALRFYRLNITLKSESRNRLKKEHLLTEMEKRYRNLVENAPYPILISKADSGEILYMNHLACEQFGIKDFDTLKFKYIDFFIEESDYLIFNQTLLTTGHVRDIDLKMKTIANESFHAYVSSTPITFDNEQAYISGFLDISYRIQLETGLKQANDTKDKFLSIIAHDLRSPISGLNSLLDLIILKPGFAADTELMHYLTIMKETTQSTFDLLENLLLWARNQKGEIKFSPTLNSINKLILSNFQFFASSARQKNVELRTQLNEDIPFYFDSEMLNTVLRNLINNAIKYTKSGGHITISVTYSQQHAHIAVKDTGIGMSQHLLSHLFSENYLTKSEKGTQGETGTGLGLVLCQEFIKYHHGEIKVKSEPNKGTEFILILPHNAYMEEIKEQSLSVKNPE